ncbi:MAG TPA: hypothetical protein VIL42_07695 [Sphingomicrobium sp.]
MLQFSAISACNIFSRMVDDNKRFMAVVLRLCYNHSMSQAPRKSITNEQWDEAAASYELGYRNGAQIARDLGVSPATVCREFRRRGARKGCRVGEVVAELVAKLDAEAADRQAAAEAKAASISALMGELIDTVFAANEAADLTLANPDIRRIERALRQLTNPLV